jgi:hypothetical protein
MFKSFLLFSTIILLGAKQLQAQTNATLPVKSKTTTVLKTPVGATAQSNGVKCAAMVINTDTSIRVNPKYVYLSVDFTDVTGAIQMELLNGNNLFWVFDKAGKEVIIKEKFLKKISAAMGTTSSNMTIKIPFKLKTDKNVYTIHYKWESKDKLKNLDLLTTK